MATERDPEARAILAELRSLANPASRAGMARYGIDTERALGVSLPALRAIARRTGRDHALALALWESGVHEARILAALVDDPAAVTKRQAERWARDFDSWDVCDCVCSALFDRAPFAWEKAREWSGREAEYVKRAGFVLAAALAVHDTAAPDAPFRAFLRIVEREAGDGRNFVKKAVNWALRQIGKRDAALHREALAAARRIRSMDAPSARWIASDAIRELEGETALRRVAAAEARRARARRAAGTRKRTRGRRPA